MAARLVAIVLVAATGWMFVPDADAGRRRRRPNMPKGHVWPPSKPMRSAGAKCLERLTALGIKWKRAGKKRKQVVTPVIVPDGMIGKVKLTPMWKKGPHVLDCHLAEALSLLSERWYLLGVRELRFSSIYQYRQVRTQGGTRKALSRHALGLAIDVYEFVDAAGAIHDVDKHYWGFDFFLPAIELLANGSGHFRTVLTPLRDPRSHDDHFHLEARVEYPEAKTKRKRKRKRKRRRRRRRSRRR